MNHARILAAVHTFPGANETLARHWPLWQRAGFARLVAIGTTGGGCVYPPGAEHVEIGADRYIAGDHLPRRLLDTARWCLAQTEWDFACLLEYDCPLFRPLPALLPGFTGLYAGCRPPGCDCAFFFHWPFIADRPTWEQIITVGEKQLARGDLQMGSPDTFLGKVIEVGQIPCHLFAFPGYTQNSIREKKHVIEAREAFRAGAVSIHGIKSAAVLAEVMAP